MEDLKRIVIVGGGFGGLAVAKRLENLPGKFNLLLIDRRNHHLFQPLLYQVAMAGLSPAEIAAPIRSILSSAKSHEEIILGEVLEIHPAEKFLMTDFGKVSFDYLILAAGANHSYFGKNSWEEFAPGLKNLEQATEIRRRILLSFELAERERGPKAQKKFLTFVVVGAGPTGVELAGALAELAQFTLAKDFEHVDFKEVRIILVEAGPKVLSSFDEALSARALKDLANLGVEVLTNTRVTQITQDGVQLGDQWIEANTVLWAAGVAASPLNRFLGGELDPSGRIKVEADLSLKKYPYIFVIGDQARFEVEGKVLPGIAPVAMQMGKRTAANIKRLLKGQSTKPFIYIDKGQMATIGRRKAVVQSGKLHLTGFFAWLVWLFIHIFYLIGLRNKVIVFIQWAWSYFTYKKGARLIVRKNWKLFDP